MFRAQTSMLFPITESPATDRERYMDDLHDLHLPDDDVRTYQHSVRSGDHVVSANVDEDQVEHCPAGS